MVLIDDLGWNNVPWHNAELAEQMPTSLSLVKEGIELDRHYTYLYCSPSRSSLLSGRLPHHVNQINLPASFATSGIHKGMTTIPRKLKDAGYATHTVGKWHAGLATVEHTPHGRGFDTHLGYFDGAEDHVTQRMCRDHCMETTPNNDPTALVDLWLTDKPALGRNGTDYGDKQYTRFAVETLRSHPLEQPIFYYIALQNNHAPLQAPNEYLDLFPSDWPFDRRHYAAMSALWDHALLNITQVLKERGMWEHTLLVLAADNGGPVYPSSGTTKPMVGGWHCG